MKLVYCSANIYLLVYISHFLPIISRRHLKHTADKCTCAWEFKKPFIFCFITLRYIQAKINEQISNYNALLNLQSVRYTNEQEFEFTTEDGVLSKIMFSPNFYDTDSEQYHKVLLQEKLNGSYVI